MVEVKESKIIEVTVGYEAFDGTRFTIKEECEKYENTANVVIKNRFKELVIKEMEGINISNGGSEFFMAAIDEDWYYALVEIKNEDDLRIAQMYHESVGYYNKHGFNNTMIGKRVIVGIGDGLYPKPLEGSKCSYNECYVYGTIEDQVEAYKNALMRLEKMED